MWESSESKSAEAAESLKIKACLQVESVSVKGNVCADYSLEQKKKASNFDSSSKLIVSGGTKQAVQNY